MHPGDAITCPDFQPAHRVMRLRLRPFTLGHVILLAASQSPFITGGRVTLRELSFAVFVCAQDHEESQRDLRSRWARFWFWLWGLTCRRLDFAKESEAFHDYLTFWNEGPKASVFGEQRQTTDDYGSTWYMRLLVLLIAEVHMTTREALSLPVKTALELAAALGESRGKLRLQSPRERAFLDYAAEQDRLKAQRMGIGGN